MMRYYFHLHTRHGTLIDEEGCRTTLADAVQAALYFARDLMSADLLNGYLDLEQSIVVAAADGEVVHELPFDQAIMFLHRGDKAKCDVPGLVRCATPTS